MALKDKPIPQLVSFSDYLEWEAALGFTKEFRVEIEGVRRKVKQLEWFARCPYCRGDLYIADTRSGAIAWSGLYHELFRCSQCAWWYQRSQMVIAASGVSETHWYIYEGVLKRFHVSDPNIPLTELSRHLASNIDDIRYVNPTVFERLIGEVYKVAYPGSEVRHVGGSGDGGVDLYVVINDEPVAVQVKRRENLGATERFTVVSALCGAMIFKGLSKGHLITTAARYGPSSIRAVEELRNRRTGIEIELKTLADIRKMLGLKYFTEESAPKLRGFGLS